MERMGVVNRVRQPTEWCSGMVVVPNTDGRVRICVDLTRLNESVRREHHPLPAVEQALAQLEGARIFSKIDANSGFWQIPRSLHYSPRLSCRSADFVLTDCLSASLQLQSTTSTECRRFCRMSRVWCVSWTTFSSM